MWTPPLVVKWVVYKMISFKRKLNEFTITGLSTMLFDADSPSSLKIPISSSIYKRIWPETIRATVFHVTDLRGLQSLKRVEGRKKSISAFFSMFARYFETGIATGGGIVVEMDADVLMSASGDIMSQVDKSGSRWTTLDYLRGTARYTNFNKIEDDFHALIKKLVVKHLTPILGKNQVISTHEYELWTDMKKHMKGDGRSLNLLIKEYFDEMEKIIRKHSDTFYSVLLGYVKKRTTDESWDEQVVNNIKIKKVHIIDFTTKAPSLKVQRDETKDVAKSNRWPIKMWDATETMDLEIYTRQVAKTELEAMGVRKR